MIRRRDFMTQAGSALAIASVPMTVLAGKRGGPAPDVDLSTGLSRDKFMALLNQEFYVQTPSDGAVALKLAELQDYPLPEGEIPTDSFTLIFQGALTPLLPEDLYTLQHGSAGSMLLRLEPWDVTKRNARYIADFCLFE